MVEYVVTTRNAKGLREEQAYTAENRSDLFKKLAADGVHAISVREGTLGKKPRKAVGGGVSPKGRVFIAAAVAVLIVGVAAWLMWPEAGKPVEVKALDKKAVKPTPQKTVECKAETNVVQVVEKEKEKPPRPKHPGFGRFPVEVDENGDRWIVRNGRRRKVIRGGRVGTSRQLWFNKAENVISALVTVKPGDPIIGFDLDNIKESFANSLMNKIEFSAEDTPEEREEKELVREAKKNLVAMIKDGGDLEAILQEEYGNIMRMYNYRNDLQKDLDKLRKDGASVQEMDDYEDLDKLRKDGASVQEMDDYVKAANEILKERGVENPVRLTAKERFMLKREPETRSKNK